ncbi:MAG TPA: SH3 domain-containing protein [Thermoplasmata archaeon]|nr:SH3 domain-containing protein [Thermoplasmata archaeon]
MPPFGIGRAARVVRALPASTRISSPPLVLRPGDRVEVHEASDEWPDFVWVTTARGERGWVPRACLDGAGARARAVRGYDTAVVSPRVGETVVAGDRVEGGWVWCRDAEGNEGWFPVDYLAPS